MPRKILIVDDNSINRAMLREILDSDYDVLEAENGLQAIEIVGRTHKLLSAMLLDIMMPVMDGFAVLEHMRADPELRQIPIIITTGATDDDAEIRALKLGAHDFVSKPYMPDVIKHRLKNTIDLRETSATVNLLQRDRLTGLYNRESFFDKSAELIRTHPAGHYVLACFDIDSFKVINDQFGNEKGDRVLKQVADIFKTGFDAVEGLVGRIMADNFAVLYPFEFMNSNELARIRDTAAVLDGSIPPISFSIGRYVVDDLSLSVSAMYDRAALAEASVKGHFGGNIGQYSESMRERLLHQQEIVNDMKRALSEHQFEVWFQPQYNHSTGALIGAEALVRWRHPDKGLISPGIFIPVFERNGFIYELDKYVWEQTCALLRKWIDAGIPPLPLSVNISRYDMLREDIIGVITGLVDKYEIPVHLLRLEVTESAFATDADRLISVVRSLIDFGFTVEIDDFGSGYSSLNTLKDVPAQIVKLDMHFLEGDDTSDRGGTIIEAIVRMAKWLGMSVIAEGVEEVEQADYLKSIGCSYIQGFLYARPMPLGKFEALVRDASVGREEKLASLQTVENLDNSTFWNPSSMDTLIFNTYVGGACIFEWHDGKIEMLRANEKYAKAIGGDKFTVEDALAIKWEEHMDEATAKATRKAIERTIETGDDTVYEAVYSGLFGEPGKTYLRTTFRAIARITDRYLLYATNENLTAQHKAEKKEHEISERMQAVMDSASSGIIAVVLNGESVDFLFASDSYYEMYGYTKEQFAAELSSPLDRIHPDDRRRVLETAHAANRIGATATVECRIKQRSGNEIWIRSVITTRSFDGVDSPVQISVNTDITAEKAAQLHIEALNEILQNMMNDAPGGFARLRLAPDGTLKVDYVNEWLCSFRGMTAEEIFALDGQDAFRSVHPDDLDHVREALTAIITTGETAHIQYRLMHIDGTSNPVNAFCRISRGSGDEIFLNIYYTDLSDEEKRDYSLREMMPYVLSAIMEYSTDLVFAKDREFRYICCSPAFVKFARRKSERDLIGKTDYDLWTKEEADHFRGDDERLFEGGMPLVNYIEPIPSDDGVQHYCSTSKYILRDSAGEIVGMYGIGRDITSERTAYEQLQFLTNSIPGGIASYLHSPEGSKLVYFNDGFCDIFGYTREEYEKISATGITNITFKEDIPALNAQIAAMRENDTPLNYTYRIHAKDGSLKWVNLRANITGRHAGIYSVNTVMFDVTESRLAAQEALVHEQEMRLAISQMGRMLCEYDPATHILTVPESYAGRYGLSGTVPDVPESLIDNGVISEDTLDAFCGLYDAILRGDSSGSAEYLALTADGGGHWERAEFSAIFDADGRTVKVIIAVEDTTQQHQKFELEQSRPTLGEKNLLIHALFNLNTGETLDYAHSDGSGVPLAERTAFLHGGDNLQSIIIDDAERARYRELNDPEKLLERYKNGESELSIDYRRRMPGGDIIWVRNLLHMVREPGGSDILLFEYCYSIEEEKTQELMYGAIVNESFDYVARINGNTRSFAIIANTGVQYGMPPQSGSDFDLAARKIAKEFVHPDDRETALHNSLVDNIKRNLAHGDRFQFTFRIIRPNGDIRYKKLTQYYLDRARDIIIAIREDITGLMLEQMQKNEQLKAALEAANEESRVKEREAAAQLKAIMNNVNGGMSATTLVDGKLGYLYVNDSYYTMFGYTQAQFESELPNGLVDIIHPDDRQAVYDMAERCVKTGTEQMEYRVYKRDGSLIWIRSIDSTCSITGIDPPVYIDVLMDITNEKKTADSLRMSEEQFRIAATIGGRLTARYDIKTGMYYHDDGDLLKRGFQNTIENAPEALIDAGCILPESVPACLDFYSRIKRGEKDCSADIAIVLSDGSVVWTRGDATVIFDGAGEPSQAIIVFSDITELREREAVYRKWQQSLQQRQKDTYTLFRCNLSKNASFDTVEGSLLNVDFSPESSSFDKRTLEYAKKCVYADDREQYAAFMDSNTLLANYYRGTKMSVLDYREQGPEDELRWLRLTVELVEYPNSSDIEAFLMYEDIDRQKKDELHNKQRAETDPLTGILNRVAFSQAVERMMAGPDAPESLALFMLDIDGFKLINDTFGHTMGDQVLVDIAQTLRGILRHGDLIGRLGGDEFLICLRGMPGDEAIRRKAEQICALLHKSINLEVYISTSIGIAVYPRDGSDFDTLYRKMDTALYAVKDHGKNNYAFYSDNMTEEYSQLAELKKGRDIATLIDNTRKRRMLIVDDSDVNLTMLAEMFKDEFIVETARDGVEALISMRRHGSGIAIVLLDLVMPGVDGFAVLQKMRTSTELSSIPVIVVSGADEQTAGLKVIECGASDFITKPINPDLLRMRVQSAISKAESDRLRAQNSMLLMYNSETAKYRAALESAGITLIEYEPESGRFLYDADVSKHIDCDFDGRTLWDILLSDGAASADDAGRIETFITDTVPGGEYAGESITVSLRTPLKQMRDFRISAAKHISPSGFPDRLIITLTRI